MSNTPEYSNKEPAPTNSLSTTSLIMGILGWSLIPIVGGMIAVITGHLAKRDIRESGGWLGGEKIANIGLVLGYSNLAIGLCVCFLLVLSISLPLGIWSFGDR